MFRDTIKTFNEKKKNRYCLTMIMYFVDVKRISGGLDVT